MKLLITGANGQLGRCLIDRALEAENIDFTAYGSGELDISDAKNAGNLIEGALPDFVINCAAYTAVDKAEEEPDLALRVNAEGPEVLANVCSKLGIPLIHVSTDYVFNGVSSEPYSESDLVSPLGVYGKTKLEGEERVKKACPKHIILRTAWVYSEYGNNFMKTMLRLTESRDELSVVHDQIGCPTYAGDIAKAILRICVSNKPEWGIYHYVGATVKSWAEFAECIFAIANNSKLITKEMRVNRIPSSEYPTPAERPAFSVLDTKKITQTFDIHPRAITDSLDEALSRYKALN